MPALIRNENIIRKTGAKWENWMLKQIAEIRLNCFERKILGRIFDPALDRGFWRIGFNGEKYKLYEYLLSMEPWATTTKLYANVVEPPAADRVPNQ